MAGQYYNEAVRAARKYFHSSADQQRFLRQMRQEAGFGDPTSPAGAQGPAQLMPGTARAWGVSNPHDPKQAYEAAAKHMAGYLHQFGGSWRDALTAYNAGPGRVGGSLPAETRHYIDVVLNGKGDASAGATGGGSSSRGGSGSISGTPARIVPGTPPSVVGGTSTTDWNGALVDSLLSGHHSLKPNSGGLLKRMMAAVDTGAYTTSTPTQVVDGTPTRVEGGTGGIHTEGGSASASEAEARANAIDRKHMPYLWGGGHAKRIIHAADATPLDCSGAVSAVLGINPRVAAQFKNWGSPGDGGNTGVTIYAKDSHVLMKINGHFFGTSHSNPGGGAGWIDAKNISPGYLAGFTVRHSG